MMHLLLLGFCALGATALPQVVNPYTSSAVSTGTPATDTAAPTGTVPISSYACHTGTDFPKEQDWMTFDTLERINHDALKGKNTDVIYDAIITSIKDVATSAGIPPELVIAQVMQESHGEITTVNDEGKSIGLMQVQVTAEAPVRCDSGTCTAEIVRKMIEQGVYGHVGTTTPPVDPGIAFYVKQQNQPFGAALRLYNSGGSRIPNPSDWSVATPSSTSSYVSDLANRLLGLPGIPLPEDLKRQCGFPLVGEAQGAPPSMI